MCVHVVCWCGVNQARKLAALQQRREVHLADGGKSVGISVGASMLVASVAGCVNVMLTNPIWCVSEGRGHSGPTHWIESFYINYV